MYRRRLVEDFLVGKKRHGLRYDMPVSAGIDLNDPATLERTDLYPLYDISAIELDDVDITWDDKFYFEPLSTDYLNRNSLLEQTTGWGGNFDPTQ